jgi:hypothetical protein
MAHSEHMRMILSSVGLMTLAGNALAHDSVIPHQHTFSNEYPDHYVWLVANLFLFSLIGLGIRAYRQRQK